MTVGEKIREWIDEIGADGLMIPDDPNSFETKEEIEEWGSVWIERVPAFRHADGTYHTEHEATRVCRGCCYYSKSGCTAPGGADDCSDYYESWRAHKENGK